jgi:hypothetical protein
MTGCVPHTVAVGGSSRGCEFLWFSISLAPHTAHTWRAASVTLQTCVTLSHVRGERDENIALTPSHACPTLSHVCGGESGEWGREWRAPVLLVGRVCAVVVAA